MSIELSWKTIIISIVVIVLVTYLIVVRLPWVAKTGSPVPVSSEFKKLPNLRREPENHPPGAKYGAVEGFRRNIGAAQKPYVEYDEDEFVEDMPVRAQRPSRYQAQPRPVPYPRQSQAFPRNIPEQRQGHERQWHGDGQRPNDEDPRRVAFAEQADRRETGDRRDSSESKDPDGDVEDQFFSSLE
jgi:hypothetical protein